MALQLCRAKKAFKNGDKVFHQSNDKCFGEGTVLSEWGAWLACSECQKPKSEGKCNCKPYRPSNGKPPLIRVAGYGTFEVLFSDGKQRAINKVWLKKALPTGRDVSHAALSCEDSTPLEHFL